MAIFLYWASVDQSVDTYFFPRFAILGAMCPGNFVNFNKEKLLL